MVVSFPNNQWFYNLFYPIKFQNKLTQYTVMTRLPKANATIRSVWQNNINKVYS